MPQSSASPSTGLPGVDVIVPCHNREDTVAEAVGSVLDQAYPGPLSVFAVDDRSSDGTVAVLQAMEDPRLHVVANDGPQGASGARNCGAKLGQAPWIAFQDSDDLWMPGKLQKQMEKVANSDFVAVYCAMAVKADTDPDTPVSKRYPLPGTSPLEGDILPSLTRNSYISTQMLVVRRDVYEKLGGFDESFRALVDWELMLRVAQEGPVAYIDEDLVIQRMSDNSITKSTEKRLESQRRVVEKHADLLARYPEALAHHHHRIAGGLKSFGRYGEAAQAAAQALRLCPTNPRYIANLVMLRGRALFG